VEFNGGQETLFRADTQPCFPVTTPKVSHSWLIGWICKKQW
jgi:hypothetical protein